MYPSQQFKHPWAIQSKETPEQAKYHLDTFCSAGSNIKSLKGQNQNPYSSVKTENKGRWGQRENGCSSYHEANFLSNYERVVEPYYLNIDYINLCETKLSISRWSGYQKALQTCLLLLSWGWTEIGRTTKQTLCLLYT